jgi:hypothetical protein
MKKLVLFLVFSTQFISPYDYGQNELYRSGPSVRYRRSMFNQMTPQQQVPVVRISGDAALRRQQYLQNLGGGSFNVGDRTATTYRPR